MEIAVKRVYEKRDLEDGTRILVDRYWPRGLSKEAARVDLWMKEIAPSAELIKWFGHRPERWEEFRRRYERELAEEERAAKVEELRRRAREGKVTLLFGAKDQEHNNAVALAGCLRC
jgi:uncharacterized protein YeaO (DUF488 family)